jgi:hypothetical protein
MMIPVVHILARDLVESGSTNVESGTIKSRSGTSLFESGATKESADKT